MIILIVVICAFLSNGIRRIANYDSDVLAVQCGQPSVIFTQLRAEDIALLVVSEGVSPDHHLVRLVQLNGQLAGAIRSRWLNALRFDASDPEQKPLQLYLKRRAIADVDESFMKDLRFERKFFDCESRQWHPAMVVAVRDVSGQLVTVHRTLLTSDGHKAGVNVPKRLMRLPDDRTINGCAIRFGEPHEVLALAEGIETALSVVVATGLPCWACICAHGLEAVEIPDGVQEVLIFADKDRSLTGERAAKVLSRRLQAIGREVVEVSVPFDVPKREKSIDWNDVLISRGQESFVWKKATYH